ncbi:MAG: hypothetical protein MK034_07410 [Dehalococcoidia bacterium]|nr:hypothetical protein [Dehalococcoidia bacterium]
MNNSRKNLRLTNKSRNRAIK